jgi:hypothetical protein
VIGYRNFAQLCLAVERAVAGEMIVSPITSVGLLARR